jgi:hypothetical protein
LAARRAECGEHDPWEAAPGVWRCWHCDQDVSRDEAVLAVNRIAAADDSRDADERPQATYSDTR